MEFLYDVCRDIFSKKYSSGSKLMKIFKIIVVNCIILAQNLQFLWNPNLNIKGWETYSKFWEIIRTPSFDAAAAQFNVLIQFFYALVGELGLFLGLFLSICTLKIFKKKVPVLLITLTRLVWTVTSEILFIPTILTFAIVYKYSSNDYNNVEEYSNNVNSKSLNLLETGKIVTIVMIVIVSFFAFVYEACAFDVKVKPEKSLAESRLHAKVNVLMKIVYFTCSILFVFFQKDNYSIYLILFLLLNGLISFGMIYYIPYYSLFMNFIKAFIHLDCSFVAIFFFTGKLLNTALIPFIASLLFQPILLVLSYETIKYRFSHIPEPNEWSEKPFEIYALSIRKYIENGELKEDLIKMMNINYKCHPNKLNRLIQSYYCVDVLKNSILGLNKIILTDHQGLDIFSNYQVYNCKSSLRFYCSENCESFKLYKYFMDFATIKTKDHKFCILYSNFLSKILEKEPKLKLLKNFVRKIAKNMKLLKRNYDEIITSFPSSYEAKEMYGSLLIHIFCEVDIGHKFMSKMSAFDAPHMKNMQKNSYNFTNDRCFFVVSGVDRIIGKIIFYNKNFLNLVGISEENAKDFYLNQIIPSLYREGHNKFLKNFIENHTNNTIFKSLPLCIVDVSGYLIECTVSSESVSLFSAVDFICTIDPIANKDRELAIITSDGFITAHTKGFPLVFGLEKPFVEGSFIKDLAPEINSDKLVPETFTKVLLRDKEKKKYRKCLIFFLKIIKIGNSSVNLLYVSEDEQEIKRFISEKNENLELNIDQSKGKLFASYIQSNFEEFKATSTTKKVEIFDEKEPNIDEEKIHEINEKSKMSSHSSSLTFLTSRESQSLNKATHVLNITKLVLLISTIVLISSNIAILSYISSEVNHSNSLQAFNHLSTLAYIVSQVALTLRVVDIDYQKGLEYQQDLNRTITNIQQLQIYQDLLFSDYDSWSYCKASKIIKQAAIPYWVFEGTPTLKTGTLHEVIGLLIQNVINIQAYEIVIQIEKNENNYENNMFFVLFNSLGSSFQQTNLALVNLVECELARVNDLSMTKNYLLIGAVIILSISAIIMSLYLLSIDKCLNILWEYLRKRAHSGYYEVKHLVTERLMQYHNEVENTDHESDNFNYKSITEIKFRHSFRYMGRFSLLFIFGALFYAVSIFVFYENIHNYLIYRPTLIHILMKRRVEMTEVCIYTLEYELGNSTFSTSYRFPYFNNLGEPKQAAENVMNSIVSTRKILRDPNIVKLMSEKLKTKLYKNIPGVSTFISLGTFRGLAYLVQEAHYLVFNNMPDSLESIKTFFSQVLEYNNLSLDVSSMANSDSKAKIENQLQKLIYFNSCCCFFLCVMYFLYFYPFLAREIALVRKITKILLIIPQTMEAKPLKSKENTTKINNC
ncbi:hypothetical protein SteCoe_35975 [Stentor coeruleus]|uniref:TmcB/TmcC TPR repeats domain-containing protein n=1 Tax=Stentor coeruleus TaxID=5963 RepID=A0A1R2AR69_9CILI|nr:hypothetical protein SteCoe_35975 [Stentor coeruleus]